MAGRPSVDLARKQWATRAPCTEFVSPGEVAHPGDTHRLMAYWTHGAGAAKIGWGTDGSFRRCVALLSKYFPKNPQGLCANLHHKATGEWPTEHGKAGIPS
jgi:hypothetical protein